MDTQNKSGKANENKTHDNWGHRERLRERYMVTENFDAFAPHEVLEMILFYIIPQKDTKPIAKELLSAFDNSLENVLNADIDRLKAIKGIKKEAALFLSLFGSLNRFIQLNRKDLPEILNSPDKMIEYVKSRYSNESNEVSKLICLDSNCRVMGCHTILEGTINFTSLEPRKIMDIVLRSNAPRVILSHNHPVSDSTPSQNDVEATRAIIRMLSQIGVKVLDHIIISPAGETAMSTIPKYMMMFR